MFYLFNGQSKEQFGPFTDVELWRQLESYAKDVREQLFVWTAGWPNWKTMADFRQGHVTPISDDGDIVREDSALLRFVPRSDINKRKFSRFPYKMKCTVKSAGTIFETQSVDISLGGIQTEHPLPEQMLTERCTIEIHGPDNIGKVHFTLNLAKRGEPKYFYFSNFIPEEIKKLEQWLTALSNTSIKRPRLKG